MPAHLIARYLDSSAHSWSIGIPGAIGEFTYDADEAIDIRRNGARISAVTARGAIQISISPATRAIAYEGLGECTQSWSQAVAFCVPADEACFTARNVLSEEGKDHDAPAAAARREVLFDLGLGSRHVRFCVRTGDERLLAVLRAGAGRPIFEPDHPAFPALREASPTRVILSALGRVEVYQNIPADHTESPKGPHTHLLPAMLDAESPGAAPPVPKGFTAALTLYPDHPLFDKYGIPKPFSRAAYEDFQELLAEYGAPDYRAAKAKFSNAIVGASGPESLKPDRARHEWLAHAVAMSQLPYLQAAREIP